MSDAIVQVNDASFDAEVLQSPVPVLLDFWAPWCGPCKMIAPLLDQVAEEFKGKVKICKMNVDDNRETPARFNVRGIPTLIMFKGGAAKATHVGALSREQLVQLINGAV